MDTTPKLFEPIPRARRWDSTLALLRQGYVFIAGEADRLGSDAFRTRLLLRPVVCMRGAEAAELFYGGGRFDRSRAVPVTVMKLLQDRGSVQQLEGEPHRVRKRMFLDLATPEAIARLDDIMTEEWWARLGTRPSGDRVVLFDALRTVLTRAACRWTGAPLTEGEAARRIRELSEMVEAAGSVGPRNWRALVLRARSERWARGLVAAVRAGRLQVPQHLALGAIARHRDADGRLLTEAEAAVELLNILRPIVAVARFMVFAALALHRHSDAGARIRGGDPGYVERFVLEVRRQAPFFPMIGGRARVDVSWRGQQIAAGEWVLLDLYGTNNDPRCWADPTRFDPDRFVGREPTAYDFVPQGGGPFLDAHRCPGEWTTNALLRTAARLLAGEMAYSVPEQDLTVDLAKVPALPKSGFVIADVRRRS